MPGIASEKERMVMMQVQRTIPILQPPDDDLRRILIVFQTGERQLSAPCINGGTPLLALAPQRVCYYEVKGQPNAQMTCTAIHLIAAAYQSARRNRYPRRRPFQLLRREALLLIRLGKRETSLQLAGTLSLWTSTAPKPNICPSACWQHFRLNWRRCRPSIALQRWSTPGNCRGGLRSRWRDQTRAPVASRPNRGTGASRVKGGALNESNALVAVDG